MDDFRRSAVQVNAGADQNRRIAAARMHESAGLAFADREQTTWNIFCVNPKNYKNSWKTNVHIG